jgi:arylsulfatase A-like enzyme
LLDQLNLSSNTVVIFLSDNGRYLGEHGQGDKRSAYDESLRIPFLLRYPKLALATNLVDGIVLNLDLAPTILDLAGLPVPPTMQGRSLKALLTGSTNGWRQAYFYEYFVEGGSVVPNLYAFRTMTNKVITCPDHDEWTELFNLADDPYETNNLAANPLFLPLRQELHAALVQQMRDTSLLAALTSPSRAADTVQLSLVGGIGPGYQVQSSTDLAAWLPLANLLMTNSLDGTGHASVTDPTATTPRKYYRARLIQNF